jgi:Protein of unknown function (DUF2848)
MTISNELRLQTVERSAASARSVHIEDLVIAGWTGRDRAALEKHIRELEEVGVARPKSTPVFYRVSATLLTTASRIDVIGADSSGEVEFVLFALHDGLWVGVGSDHTDRKAETIGVTLSKQLCAKPVAPVLWRYDDVKEHWDHLTLRSHAVENSKRRLYQQGRVSAMLAPEDLIERYCGAGERLPVGTAMFGGTLAAEGGVRFAPRFAIELEDPVLGRRIAHEYEIRSLPVQG